MAQERCVQAKTSLSQPHNPPLYRTAKPLVQNSTFRRLIEEGTTENQPMNYDVNRQLDPATGTWSNTHHHAA